MIERRKCARFSVQGATVSYRTLSFWLHFLAPSDESCPVIDLSKGGLSFLTNRPPWKGKDISLLLHCADWKDPLSLKGKVVHVGISPGKSYTYRIGAEFKPFDGEERGNPLESLEKLDALEKAHATT